MQASFFSQYESYLVAAIFLIAFHGFFRMGELIGHNRKLAKKVFQYSDVFKENHTLKIILRYYKTRRSHRPTHVSIFKENSKFCPVRALNRYLRVRGQHSGPLFLLADGKPITSRVFNRYFRQVLNWLGLSPRYYKPHSFRIGSCTEAIMRGGSPGNCNDDGPLVFSSCFQTLYSIRIMSFSAVRQLS